MRAALPPLLVAAAVPLLAMPPAARCRAAELVPPPNLPSPDSWEPRQTGVLNLLDKVSAQQATLTMHVGDTADFETLHITLSSCQARPATLPADSAARVAIVDTTPGAPGFSGWILADEPAAAMLQSANYDVQLARCQ